MNTSYKRGCILLEEWGYIYRVRVKAGRTRVSSLVRYAGVFAINTNYKRVRQLFRDVMPNQEGSCEHFFHASLPYLNLHD